MILSPRETEARTADRAGLTVLGVGAAVALTFLAPRVWPFLILDGLYPAALLASACGWGAWPSCWLFGPQPDALRTCCVAAAIGLGVLALATLALGVMGLLSGGVAWALLICGGLLGAFALRGKGAFAEQAQIRPAASGRFPIAVACLGGLALVVPLAVLLFGACLPPGILWQGEGGGYDALEYHLQAPREYYDAGRIQFLPHNVYAQFPQQMEMLYLLLMYLCGGAYAAAIPAQLLHAACGATAVALLATQARSSTGGWFAAVAAGGAPILVYCGVLAYVECGMLLFAAAAGCALLDAMAETTRARAMRLLIAAGVFAGLAAGCKYTALALVVGGLAGGWFIAGRGPLRRRAVDAALLVGVALAAMSPWLARNAAFTGNPVYPFGYAWFGGAAWSGEQAEQWARGHRLRSTQAAPLARAELAADELISSGMFGPGLFAIPALAVLLLRGRALAFAWAWMLLTIAGWVLLTHMPGRFAIPIVVPLALAAALAGDCLAGSASADGARRRPRWPLAAAMLLAGLLHAVMGGVTLARLLNAHAQDWRSRADIPLGDMVGATDLFREAHPVNANTPADANVWIIGDAAVFYVDRRLHYSVVFNRDPWLALLRDAPADSALRTLRDAGVTHVYVSWTEIERLSDTYGMPMKPTPTSFDALVAAGLKPLGAGRLAGDRPLWSIYALPTLRAAERDGGDLDAGSRH